MCVINRQNIILKYGMRGHFCYKGGGGAGKDAHARNRGMVAGGGKSKEGGDGGASGRAELVSDRWEEEE